MHPNNSNSGNGNVHINPVFNRFTIIRACSPQPLYNSSPSLVLRRSEAYSARPLECNENENSFRNFIKEKFNELRNEIFHDSLKASSLERATLSSGDIKFHPKNQNFSPSRDISSPSVNDQVPFYAVFSKGWFFHSSCDTNCTRNLPFDVQSCCFINERCLPENTLNMNQLKKSVLDFYKTKILSIKSNNSLVSVSKHKLVRKSGDRLKENSVCKSPISKRKYSNALVMCTRRKLIRKGKLTGVSLSPSSKSEKLLKNIQRHDIIKRHSIVRVNPSENSLKTVTKRKRLNSSRLSNSSPVIVLTKRKLIRKSLPTQEPSSPLVSISRHKLNRKIKSNNGIQESSIPEKLISINPNKLVRSSLLGRNIRSRNETFFAKSVLYHVIKYRRRTHRGSGYVLLTRNKLIKRAKVKNTVWKKNKTTENSPVQRSNRLFVSLGNNKLIRKSLFTKNNQVNLDKRIMPISSPIKNKFFTRWLNARSRRIQHFTNHMTRMNLKYINDRTFSRRFPNKHKNNKKIIRKKRNSICSVFRKKGTCARLLKGECPLIHDRKYVTLCNNFIKNSCDNKQCSLSHDFISQKISICRLFLLNKCRNEDCLYLHVKPTLEAAICVQFLRGYCENGERCASWHVYACPEFKSSSQCSKGDSCRLPHRDLSYFEGKVCASEEEDGNNWRYFEKNKLDNKNDASISIIPERQCLGHLPDYIPI